MIDAWKLLMKRVAIHNGTNAPPGSSSPTSVQLLQRRLGAEEREAVELSVSKKIRVCSCNLCPHSAAAEAPEAGDLHHSIAVSTHL